MQYQTRNVTAVLLMLLGLACGGGSPTSPTPTAATPPPVTPAAPSGPVNVSLTVELTQATAASGPQAPRTRDTRQRRKLEARLKAQAERRARLNISCGVTIAATTHPFPTLSRTDVVVEPPTGLEINAPLTLDLAFPIPSGDLRVSCTGTSADAGVQVSITGGEATFPLASTTPVSSTCTSSATVICLDGLSISATATNAGGQTVDGRVARDLDPNTGYLWFFSENNFDVVVDVLNRCAQENRYWVFMAGLTDVRHAITISATNTATGVTRTYVNPQGERFTSLEDREAIPCR